MGGWVEYGGKWIGMGCEYTITSYISRDQYPNPKWEGGIGELGCGQHGDSGLKSESVRSKVEIERIRISRNMSVSITKGMCIYTECYIYIYNYLLKVVVESKGEEGVKLN